MDLVLTEEFHRQFQYLHFIVYPLENSYKYYRSILTTKNILTVKLYHGARSNTASLISQSNCVNLPLTKLSFYFTDRRKE